MSSLRLLFGLALSLLPLLAVAQSSTTRGPYTIHYSALPSTLISPEVARNSGLTRSASRGLLNIAVIKKDEAREHAVTAVIEASATNAAGQRQSLRMREVREGEAIYYLGEPRISEGERLDFEVQVTPEGAGEPVLLRFAQTFHP
ncbi:MAG: DUF4426 domain-containing protein [Xanthomonadales bacterium]|nr:DUF4426 domain-containing protein [Xanthomonadales bacterium]